MMNDENAYKYILCNDVNPERKKENIFICRAKAPHIKNRKINNNRYLSI